MNDNKRTKVIAGNWKMNKLPSETAPFVKEIAAYAENVKCTVIVCVPFVCLSAALYAAQGTNVKVGAQNCHWEKSGAFTGEISADMLKDMGVNYVIIGHSERRQYFGETDLTVNKRLKAALGAGLLPIVCIGETLEQRNLGITNEILSQQVKVALGGIDISQMKNIIIAYEPVWAIGTGVTASSEQANSACKCIRNCVKELYNEEVSNKIIIQYGGSMNTKNAQELLAMEDIDGGLIGGAALKSADFGTLITIANK